MNIAILILTILGIVSDMVELTYEAGAFTRKYIVPAMIMAYVVTEHYIKKVYELEMDIEMSTPALGFG